MRDDAEPVMAMLIFLAGLAIGAAFGLAVLGAVVLRPGRA